MPAYFMIGQPTGKGKVYKRGTIHAMRGFSDSTISQLIEAGVIQELITPPVSVFVKLKKYVKILKKLDIITLGDFAVAHISDLSKVPDAKALQKEVLDLINPNNAVSLDDCNCTHPEAPKELPYAT